MYYFTSLEYVARCFYFFFFFFFNWMSFLKLGDKHCPAYSRRGYIIHLYTSNFTTGVLHLMFLAMNPNMVFVSLYALLQFFTCFRSLLVVISSSNFSCRSWRRNRILESPSIHVVCMITIYWSKVHDFTFVHVKWRVPLFRPMDNLFKIRLDGFAIGSR